jgi:hypothetical protein
VRRLECPREQYDSVSALQMLRDLWGPDVRGFEPSLRRLPGRRGPAGHPDDLANRGVRSECLDNTRPDVARRTDHDDLHGFLSEPKLSAEVALFEPPFESAQEPGRLGAIDQTVVVGQR